MNGGGPPVALGDRDVADRDRLALRVRAGSTMAAKPGAPRARARTMRSESRSFTQLFRQIWSARRRPRRRAGPCRRRTQSGTSVLLRATADIRDLETQPRGHRPRGTAQSDRDRSDQPQLHGRRSSVRRRCQRQLVSSAASGTVCRDLGALPPSLRLTTRGGRQPCTPGAVCFSFFRRCAFACARLGPGRDSPGGQDLGCGRAPTEVRGRRAGWGWLRLDIGRWRRWSRSRWWGWRRRA